MLALEVVFLGRNGHAVGSPVENRPDWMRVAIPASMHVGFLGSGVCEICELFGESRWTIGSNHYVYCTDCARKDVDEHGPLAGFILGGI